MRRTLSLLFCLLCFSAVALAQSPVPLINQPLVPEDAQPGGPAFTLTVNGTGFLRGATVSWNGTALLTTFVSQSQLTAAVPAGDIASARTATITVSNPGVGAASNAIYFPVSQPRSLVTFVRAPGTPLGVGVFGTYADPGSMAAWDFNGDGKLDLALAFPPYPYKSGGPGTLRVLLGNGNGTFTLDSSSAPVGTGPDSMVVGDFNGDGRADLAVVNGCSTVTPTPSNFIDNSVSILLGNGDGSFKQAAGSPIPVGHCPYQIVAGDFNGDGKLDLAVGNDDFSDPQDGSVTILLGNGDGTFTPAPGSPITVSGSPMALAVGDFNGDGKLDLAVANYNDTIDVLLGNGNGTFTPAPGSPILVKDPSGGDPLYDLVTGDFNGDGKLDLAAAGWNNDVVFMFLGNGDGTFTEAPISGNPMQDDTRTLEMVEGDFYGDGKLDLAMADDLYNISGAETGYLATMQGHGDGTLTEGEFSALVAPYAYALVAGDFNDDGKLDFAESTDGVWVELQEPVANAPGITIAPDGAVPTQFPAASTLQTVTAGETATFSNLTVFSLNGYTGAPTLTCTGAPVNSTCTVTPSTVDLCAALLGYPFTLSVKTEAASSSLALPRQPPEQPQSGWQTGLGVLLLALLLAAAMSWAKSKPVRSRSAKLAALAVLLFSVTLLATCGSGGGPGPSKAPPSGTPPGTYTIIVTAASGSISHSQAFTLTVQ